MSIICHPYEDWRYFSVVDSKSSDSRMVVTKFVKFIGSDLLLFSSLHPFWRFALATRDSAMVRSPNLSDVDSG
jgi:hypothetical protein